jgi:hypothetical protein
MRLDELFWEIVGMPENADQPLSFRSSGAWVCRVPAFAEHSFDDSSLSPDELARRVSDWAMAQAARSDLFTLDRLLALTGPQRRGPPHAYLAPRVVALLLAQRAAEAAMVCRAAIEARHAGGFTCNDLTFPEMALRWMSAHRPTVN